MCWKWWKHAFKNVLVVEVPSLKAMSSWLASQLQRHLDQDSTNRQQRNRPKSVSEGRNPELERYQQRNRFNGERLQKSTFVPFNVSWYVVDEDGVTQTIMSVQFDETRSVWNVDCEHEKWSVAMQRRLAGF